MSNSKSLESLMSFLTENSLYEKLMDIESILKKIESYYKQGYFVYDFNRLLEGKEPDHLIPIEENILKKPIGIHPYIEPKELLETNSIYIETIFYLFGLWAFKYLTGKDYNYDLSMLKFPGLFQFFESILREDFKKRTSSFDELYLYLEIAKDEISGKNYKKEENDYFIVEGMTTVGLKRFENQDCFDFKIEGDKVLLVIADGMGGGEFGDVAAKIAVSTFMMSFEKIFSSQDIDACLLNLLEAANERILNFKKSKNVKSMGTTLSVVAIKGDNVHFVHVGDSRIYIRFFGEEQFHQITLDHSLAEVEYRKGNITEKEKDKYKRNILAFALGSEKLGIQDVNTTTDYKPLSMTDIEQILLCTDGCWDIVDEKDFNKDVRTILQIAHSFITYDNSTVIKLINKRKFNDEVTKENKGESEPDKPVLRVKNFIKLLLLLIAIIFASIVLLPVLLIDVFYIIVAGGLL
jgi:protein phosphatase